MWCHSSLLCEPADPENSSRADSNAAGTVRRVFLLTALIVSYLIQNCCQFQGIVGANQGSL